MRTMALAALAFAVLVGTLHAQGVEDARCDAAGACAASGAALDSEDDASAYAQLRVRPASAATKPLCDHSPPGHSALAGRALGVLQLDGYYWPTQPGDINDLRTWCTVEGVDGDLYRCKGVRKEGEEEFGLKIATIVNGSWPKIQEGYFDELEQSFTQAVEYLLKDPDVHAIMGNAGWFTWYQYKVSRIMRDLVIKYRDQGITLKRKPWLGGSPAMLAAMGKFVKGVGETGEQNKPIVGWNLLKKQNDRILLLTSNTKLNVDEKMKRFLISLGLPLTMDASKAMVREAMRKTLKVDVPEDEVAPYALVLSEMRGLFEDFSGSESEEEVVDYIRVMAQKIILLPWEKLIGYGVAVTNPGAMFHNVAALIRGSSNGAQLILQTINRHMKRGENIVGIIMESTEMPAYSNWVRNITRLPVWDSTIVGKCLMAAAPEFNADKAQADGIGPTLFNTEAFRNCMMGWWTADRYEERAGLQKDGKIKYYDTMNLTPSQLDELVCTGGRPTSSQVIGRRMEDFDTGVFGPPKVHASCLTAMPCGGRTWLGTNCGPSAYGGIFSNYGGCYCQGACPAGYYCGGESSFDVPGLENAHGGKGYVYGIRGEGYATYKRDG